MLQNVPYAKVVSLFMNAVKLTWEVNFNIWLAISCKFCCCRPNCCSFWNVLLTFCTFVCPGQNHSKYLKRLFVIAGHLLDVVCVLWYALHPCGSLTSTVLYYDVFWRIFLASKFPFCPVVKETRSGWPWNHLPSSKHQSNKNATLWSAAVRTSACTPIASHPLP